MIYEQNCYNLNVKYFDNLIEISIKNFPKKKFFYFLDYIYCNIQAHILYVINANYTMLLYSM